MACVASIEEDMVVGVVAAAAVFSPRARRIARQGAVYGLAGALKAGDVAVAAARGAARGAQSPQAADAASATSSPEAGKPPEESPQTRGKEFRAVSEGAG